MTVREPQRQKGSHFFFAGGGTGGHIYPAISVAEQIARIEPEANIHFFCSARSIDKRVLDPAGFRYTVLPARGLAFRPRDLWDFCRSFVRSYKTARQAICQCDSAVVIGVGGYVSAPVCLAAHKHNVPIALLNVDIVPGRANRLMARWANKVFVQFDQTAQFFSHKKVNAEVTGCPLRSGFGSRDPGRAIEQLGLNRDKKVLLITGASSGSQSINRTVCSLLEELDTFADNWQIVHLTGLNNENEVAGKYDGVRISHKVLAYFDDMPSLLAAADLLIGRSGAVSIAEYAAAAVPSICMPYPHHKDRHQYLNAGKLVEAGAAIIVDDLPDEKDRAEWLWEDLKELMEAQEKRDQMAAACKTVARADAALKIAERLVETARGR